MEETNDTLLDSETTENGGTGEEFDVTAGFNEEYEEAAAPKDTTEDASDESSEDEQKESEDDAKPASEEDDPKPDEADTTSDDDSGKLTFKAKIDHQEKDVSITVDDLPAIYQKAENMDRAVQRAETAKQEVGKYREYVNRIAALARTLNFEGDTPEATIDAMLSGVRQTTRDEKVSALVEAGTAKEVAEYIVDQQMTPAKEASSDTASEEEEGADDGAEEDAGDDGGDSSEDNDPSIPSPEQFSTDLQALFARRPSLKTSGKPFPDEVLQAYMHGENLTVAYLDYESRQVSAEKDALEKQNSIFKQNQESAKKGPVKKVSGGGGTGGKEDPWTAGFNDSYW